MDMLYSLGISAAAAVTLAWLAIRNIRVVR